jgi:hypothetical protein
MDDADGGIMPDPERLFTRGIKISLDLTIEQPV